MKEKGSKTKYVWIKRVCASSGSVDPRLWGFSFGSYGYLEVVPFGFSRRDGDLARPQNTERVFFDGRFDDGTFPSYRCVLGWSLCVEEGLGLTQNATIGLDILRVKDGEYLRME